MPVAIAHEVVPAVDASGASAFAPAAGGGGGEGGASAMDVDDDDNDAAMANGFAAAVVGGDVTEAEDDDDDQRQQQSTAMVVAGGDGGSGSGRPSFDGTMVITPSNQHPVAIPGISPDWTSGNDAASDLAARNAVNTASSGSVHGPRSRLARILLKAEVPAQYADLGYGKMAATLNRTFEDIMNEAPPCE